MPTSRQTWCRPLALHHFFRHINSRTQSIRNFSSNAAKSLAHSPLSLFDSTSSISPKSPNDHLFRYTSGRWLWNEEQQLKHRYRYFNVPELKKVACQAADSSRCVSLEKIGEGNYNKGFRLVMQDGQKVIAKISHPNAGPPVYTTASEIATMDFARTILKIPVPKVLAWSATNQNPVESEYIIMEEAEGTQLHEAWKDMKLKAKRDVI